uniref:Acetylglutamate kinase n=1 Tax=Acrochaetium secundatum TaxID=209631 RepID=A0A4D6BK07_9FLOR|nr:acetylglutamate kinase [Acrochaetium secundatum]QBX88384.1 acetylglutamate kinase [Acrochaetium secundatum]
MNRIFEAETIISLMPYLNNKTNKKVVIKYGGAAMIDNNLTVKVIEDIAILSLLGFNITLVHGGGPMINQWLQKIKIEPKFEDGVRITDVETMEVVQMVLAGKVNKNLVDLFKQYNLQAVGISGQDANLIVPEPMQILSNNRVADIKSVNIELLNILLEKNYIPIIAPTASDHCGVSYNINADIVAGRVASSLKADNLIILTDTEGILQDNEDSSSIISHLNLDETSRLIDKGIIQGGMLPKVNCCIQALNNGVKVTRIIDGRIPHSLLLSLLSDTTVGSMISL